jgi:hypothetical protein
LHECYRGRITPRSSDPGAVLTAPPHARPSYDADDNFRPDASSSDAAIAAITGTSSNVLTIGARAAGSAEIRVQTARGED